MIKSNRVIAEGAKITTKQVSAAFFGDNLDDYIKLFSERNIETTDPDRQKNPYKSAPSTNPQEPKAEPAVEKGIGQAM